MVDFEEGLLTAASLGIDVPVIQPKCEEDILRILETPESVIEEIHEVEKFKDYEVETWAFDSLTSMQSLLLGCTYRPATDNLPERKGTGILGVTRVRYFEGEPQIEDFVIVMGKIIGFMNAVRQMRYNTIVTCHSELEKTEDSPKGLNVEQSRVKHGGYPSVIGKIRYRLGGLADFFLYMEAVRRGNSLQYKAHTINQDVWKARNRMQEVLPHEIEDPTFDKIMGYYREARSKE